MKISFIFFSFFFPFFLSLSLWGKVTEVGNSRELNKALGQAEPGDTIYLKEGVYPGHFVIKERRGTRDRPITLQGSGKAILKGAKFTHRYVLYLNKVSFWNIIGLGITNGKKGIVLDEVEDSLLEKIQVYDIGQEGIHFRKNSRRNILRDSTITQTGKMSPGLGEGIYIGSSKSNAEGDRSDENEILNNHIGPGVTAEAIDIKEYTSGGKIIGNIIDGRGMSGENFADSWLDVKGNNYVIRGNRGKWSLKDGFQVHVLVPGWGQDNLFEQNHLEVMSSGYGIFIDKGERNVVHCNNEVSHADKGMSNIPCTSPGRTLGEEGKSASPDGSFPLPTDF